MKLEELLKDSPEALKAINDAISKANEGQEDKLKHVRFADLSEGAYVSKDKYANLEADLSEKATELEKANGLIEELKKGNGKNEALQKKITDYESEIANLKAENEAMKLEGALKLALVSEGAVDVDYLLFKSKEAGEVKLNDDGSVKGVDSLISTLKTQHPAMFGASKSDPQAGRKVLENGLPNGNTEKTVTKEQFAKMGYQARNKLYSENPELYKELSNS